MYSGYLSIQIFWVQWWGLYLRPQQPVKVYDIFIVWLLEILHQNLCLQQYLQLWQALHLQPKQQVFPVTHGKRYYMWAFLITEWYGLYELILFSLILSWQNTEGNSIFCLSFCAHTCCAESVGTYGGKTIEYLLAQCLNNYPDTICSYLKFSIFTRWLADCYNEKFHPKFCFRKVGEIFVYAG